MTKFPTKQTLLHLAGNFFDSSHVEINLPSIEFEIKEAVKKQPEPSSPGPGSEYVIWYEAVFPL